MKSAKSIIMMVLAASPHTGLADGALGVKHAEESASISGGTAGRYQARCSGSSEDAYLEIQSAIDNMADGGEIVFPHSTNCLIKHNLIVRSNVILKGDLELPRVPARYASYYKSLSVGFALSPDATVFLESGSGIIGLSIYRQGLTLPAPNAAAFSGTAVTIAGDDAFVSRSMILGFNRAIVSAGHQRPRFESVYGDNTNGIEISGSFDVAYIVHCHMWPFATMAENVSHENLERDGTAYDLHDGADWAKITDSFSYGYKLGFHVRNANSVTLVSVGADNTKLQPNSSGIAIDGTSTDVRLIAPQVAAQSSQGILIATNAGLHTEIIAANAWRNGAHGILIRSGDVNVVGGEIRETRNGITVESRGSSVTITNVSFRSVDEYPISVLEENYSVFADHNDYGLDSDSKPAIGGKLVAQKIRSAGNTVLPRNGDDFIVLGNADIRNLSSGWRGREITLYFSEQLMMYSSTGNSGCMHLKEGRALRVEKDQVLKLRHNGVQWFEVGRS